MQWGKRQVLAHVAADGSETYKRIMLEGDAPTDARPTLDLDPTKVVAGGATSAFNGLTHLSLASGDVLDSDPGSDPPGGPVDA